MICFASAEHNCPEEACAHSTKFWQTYNCFSDPAISWPDGGLFSVGGSIASYVGIGGVTSCDLRFTEILPTAPICLLNFQGTDILLEDLSASTNNTALMLQEYYTFAVGLLFGYQVSNGPCPVGPGGFPSGVPMEKRATFVEVALLAAFRVIANITLNPVAALAGPNCDFSLVDPNGPEVTQAREFITQFNSQRLQCVEDLEEDCAPTDGCTHSQGFWKTHLPWVGTNGAEDNKLCGIPWTDWLQLKNAELPEFGNAQRILARQWIAAKLNELTGACVPTTVDLLFAERTLTDNCAFTIESSNSQEGQLMIGLSKSIEEFNLGIVGPGSCVAS